MTTIREKIKATALPSIIKGSLYVHQVFAVTRDCPKAWGYRSGATITAKVRFDDQCGSGHQIFAITADIQEPREKDVSACGCLRDEISQVFPELAPFIKWHLASTDGPRYSIADTIYHASNLDCNGYAAGEPCGWDIKLKFKGFPITFKFDKVFGDWLVARIEFNNSTLPTNPNRVGWEPVAVAYVKGSGDTYDCDPKYTLRGFGVKWHKCPFDTLEAAQEFCSVLKHYQLSEDKVVTQYSKGKERNFAAARSTAVWPEATDEQLSLPKDELTALLQARLPALLEEFKLDMAKLGFERSAQQVEVRS